MPRAKYKIEDRFEASIARRWISNQMLEDLYFPFSDDDINNLDKRDDAKLEFEELDTFYPGQLNDWCESYLNGAQWKKLKGTIRAERLRGERKNGNKNPIVRIDVSEEAGRVLKRLSENEGLTYSQLIVKYMVKV